MTNRPGMYESWAMFFKCFFPALGLGVLLWFLAVGILIIAGK